MQISEIALIVIRMLIFLPRQQCPAAFCRLARAAAAAPGSCMGVEADVQRTGDPQQPGAGSDAPCPFPLGICSSASHGRRPWMLCNHLRFVPTRGKPGKGEKQRSWHPHCSFPNEIAKLLLQSAGAPSAMSQQAARFTAD